MASRDLDDLIPPVRDRAKEMIEMASMVGIEFLIYCTWRSEEEQAILYRTNRTLSQIKAKADCLEDLGYPDLARILMDAPPQPGASGPKRTKAGPGESMHQHRRAFDGVPVIGGKPLWQVFRYGEMLDPWVKLGSFGDLLGLAWLGHSSTFREYVHWQWSAPLSDLMKERYG